MEKPEGRNNCHKAEGDIPSSTADRRTINIHCVIKRWKFLHDFSSLFAKLSANDVSAFCPIKGSFCACCFTTFPKSIYCRGIYYDYDETGLNFSLCRPSRLRKIKLNTSFTEINRQIISWWLEER